MMLQRRSQRVWAGILSILIMGTITLGNSRRAFADDDDKERRERIIKGVLELLLEKEMKKNRPKGQPQNPPNPDPQFNPNPPNNPRFPGPGPNPIRIDPRELQSVVDGFTTEITNLSQILTTQVQRFPQLRGLLADAFQVRAQAAALQQNLRGRPQFLQRDVQMLDQSWRNLSHRLQEVRGLPPQISTSIQTLDQLDARLCKMFNIEPQVNREALSQQATLLVAYWQSLIDDLRFELANPRERQQFQINGQRIQQRVRGFQQSVTTGRSPKELVEEYQQIGTSWDQYSQALRQFQKPYLERSMSRIDQTDQAIRELLWISRGVDRQQLLHLVKGLKQSTSHLYEHITLDILLKVPNYQTVPASADQLQGLYDHMLDCLQRNEPVEELMDAYSYLPSAWVAFSRPFATLQRPQIQQEFQQIELQLSALQQALGLKPQFSHDQAGRYAVTLQDRAEHLKQDLQLALQRSQEQIPPPLVYSLLQQTTAVANSSKRIHELCTTGAPVEKIRQETTQLFQQWLTLSQRLDKLPVIQGDEHVGELISQISATLVELETLLAF